MIGSSRRLRVFANGEPTDMRKSFDTLSAVVTQSLGRDPLSGDLFLFVGKNRKTAKVLYFDGTGLCVFAKRLERGRFAAAWERSAQSALEWTTTELALFLEGSALVGRVALSPKEVKVGSVVSREMFEGVVDCA